MYGPIDDIIPRELDPNVKDLMNKLSLVISKFVDFGSNILKWDMEVERTEYYNAPVIMSLRHFLELIDSVSVLVKQSSIEPCKLQLRGMLETYFSLSYLLEEDTERRGMAFLVWHLHKQIKELKQGDADSEMGKQMRARLKKDKHTKNINVPTDPDSKAKIAAKEALLQQPVYQEAEQEYQRLRSLKENDPTWYRFYGGPRNVLELAECLECMGIYDIVYRSWSGPVHGTDIIIGKVSLADDDSAAVIQIRHFKDVQEVVQWTLNLSLMMFKPYIDKRIPDRESDYTMWFMTIREPYLRITSREPLLYTW